MVRAGTPIDDRQILDYIDSLTTLQDQLLALLEEKRVALRSGELDQLRSLGSRETEVQERMVALQHRRAEILTQAQESGDSCTSLEELARSRRRGCRDDSAATDRNLIDEVTAARQRMRLLQHETLTNWVVEQSTLLHLSRMLEIIARGGRMQATYRKKGPGDRKQEGQNRGALVDREV